MNEKKTVVVAFIEEGGITLQQLIDQAGLLPHDILIVDDGSSLSSIDALDERIKQKFKHLTYESCEGFGAFFINAYEIVRDLGYDYMITIDPANIKLSDDIGAIDENLAYGFDIVSSSRILENFNHQRFSEDLIEATSTLSRSLFQISGIDLTDPLSETKGFRIEALKNMELTEYSHGIFLQLYIQAAYFGLTTIEIPLTDAEYLGHEFVECEETPDLFDSIMETEKYLYQKGIIN